MILYLFEVYEAFGFICFLKSKLLNCFCGKFCEIIKGTHGHCVEAYYMSSRCQQSYIDELCESFDRHHDLECADSCSLKKKKNNANEIGSLLDLITTK